MDSGLERLTHNSLSATSSFYLEIFIILRSESRKEQDNLPFWTFEESGVWGQEDQSMALHQVADFEDRFVDHTTGILGIPEDARQSKARRDLGSHSDGSGA